MIEEDEYFNNIKSQNLLEVLTLYLPTEFIWRKKINVNNKICKKELLLNTKSINDRDWMLAKKFFIKGNIEKCFKIIDYILINIMMLKQLITKNDKNINFNAKYKMHYYQSI